MPAPTPQWAELEHLRLWVAFESPLSRLWVAFESAGARFAPNLTKTFFFASHFSTLAEPLREVVLVVFLPRAIKLRILTKACTPGGIDGSPKLRLRKTISAEDTHRIFRETRQLGT